MSLDDRLLQQLMESFRQELAERLADTNAGLLALEQNPEKEQKSRLLEELFRNVHSLKGAARAVDLKPIEELTHGMEDVFGAAKRGSIQLTPILFDLLYQGLDLIGAVMAGVEAGRGLDTGLDLPGYLVKLAAAWRSQPIQPLQVETIAPAAEASPALLSPVAPAAAPAAIEPTIQPWNGNGDTIRVPTTRLDELMAQTGELLVARLRAAQQIEEIQRIHTSLLRWQRDWKQVRGPLTVLSRQSGNGIGTQVRAFFEQGEEQLRSLVTQLGELTRRVSDDANRLSLITDELQDGVKRTRMLPLETFLRTLRRIVRDLAREKGVEVTLEIQGADTEMDKHVLEQIKDPLIHLLRNAIDHGIELPEERLAKGKPRRGTITLCAERRGNAIIVEVADDGAGIDIDAVHDAALRRGLLDEATLAEMSAEQVSSLVFSAGLSTSSMITAVSGRGVGLDVVRKNVEALQGRAEVRSVPNESSTFTLVLPLTLVSTRCLLIRAAGRTFAVPISAIERLVSVNRDDIRIVEGKEAIRWQDHPLALVRLADVLRLPNGGQSLLNGNKLPAVILASGRQRIAFLVDELLGEEDIVVKSLGKQLARVPNVAGAAVLGTGGVVFILNVSDLVMSAQQTTSQRALPTIERREVQARRQTILVVDDSITTRTLEKNILTTAGYVVKLATDGEEALATLADNNCDLIVADIDMPRLNGFELTERVKQDSRHHHLPVILVTSLDSPEHKARGIAVGADAYIAKSAFDQDNLLATIRQLI